MHILLQILFALGILGILHSYLFYPLLLRWLGRNRPPHNLVFADTDPWPVVSVIMSVYNEEAVIGEKLESLAAQEYPGEIRVHIGSDCSADRSNEIVEAFCRDHDHFSFYAFSKRRGKPPVINDLARRALKVHSRAPGHIFLITDASVMLTTKVVYHLVKHFRDEKIAVVDAHMVHTGMRHEGISRAENQYISSEVRLKYLEGLVWGKMVGPFGGCYAVRSTHFSEVPPNYLVDDFYITLRALEKGGDAISDLAAVCFEPVSHAIKEEYRRKARISAGNFQNLLTFKHLWWPPVGPLRFAFFSHKVLRWLGPFFIFLIFGSSGLLALQGNQFFGSLFLIMVAGCLVALFLEPLLTLGNLHLLPLRSIRYFLIMNAALLQGFFKFLKGIRSNVWEPPKRIQ